MSRRPRSSEIAFTLSAPEYRERVAKLAALSALVQGPALTAVVREVARETGFTQRDVRAVFVAALHAHARAGVEKKLLAERAEFTARRADKEAHLERELVAGAAAVARGLRGPAASAAAMAGAVFAGQPVVLEPGTEPVLRCCECGTESTASVTGRAGWTHRRRNCAITGDVCPKCGPVEEAVTRQLAALRAAVPDLLTFRPENSERLDAYDRAEAVALRDALRAIGIGADVGVLPETGLWVQVWVSLRNLPRAKLVAAGFHAGVRLPR